MAPMPGDRRRFDPVDEEEAAWCHMERSVNATLPLLMKFGHEFDYGSPTGRSSCWLGTIPAGCLRCRRPQWKSVPEFDENEEYYAEYDDETRCTRTKE